MTKIVDVNGVKLLAIKVADVDMNGLRNLGDLDERKDKRWSCCYRINFRR
mgnify:CR=1 FL=1